MRTLTASSASDPGRTAWPGSGPKVGGRTPLSQRTRQAIEGGIPSNPSAYHGTIIPEALRFARTLPAPDLISCEKPLPPAPMSVKLVRAVSHQGGMMPNRILPALSRVQQTEKGYVGARGDGVGIVQGALVVLIDGAIGPILEPAPTIAVANAALEDDDPRKITPEWVSTLRAIADGLVARPDHLEAKGDLRAIADGLAAYLPESA